MSFFFTFPTLPEGFTPKFLFPMHSNHKANPRHLKIIPIPQLVFEMTEAISPPSLAQLWPAQPSPLEDRETTIGTVTTAQGHPTATVHSDLHLLIAPGQ